MHFGFWLSSLVESEQFASFVYRKLSEALLHLLLLLHCHQADPEAVAVTFYIVSPK